MHTPHYQPPHRPTSGRRMWAGVAIGCAALPVLAFAGCMVIVAAPGPSSSGGEDGDEPAAEEQDDAEDAPALLLAYLDTQAAAAQAALDGDPDAPAALTEHAADTLRYYDGEPGDPDGEWVHHHDWAENPGACTDHLAEGHGWDGPDAQLLCQTAFALEGTDADYHLLGEPGGDLDAWCAEWWPDTDRERCAEEADYWAEDAADYRDRLTAAVDDAHTLVEQHR